jgi:methylated-DNA-[protein]-cysteine S-methyltransferase
MPGNDLSPHLRCHVFETVAGFCAIAWNSTGLVRFGLPAATAGRAEEALLRRLPQAVPSDPDAFAAGIVERARRYFRGEPVDFSDIPLDLGRQDAFFARVYSVVRNLGRGQTTTYGAVAKTLGTGPESARAVGQAMANNPVPLIIPCHRVLAAGNRMGGFSAPGGADSKRKMLELEGVKVPPPPPVQQELAF